MRRVYCRNFWSSFYEGQREYPFSFLSRLELLSHELRCKYFKIDRIIRRLTVRSSMVSSVDVAWRSTSNDSEEPPTDLKKILIKRKERRQRQLCVQVN
jgi:hypothetical protein